ncbi:hypothetical protein BJ138DRAFT_1013523 [Hygrophoropsis aurantiaca]|uniref:Uncharacterized protein n=1 Tax=Hygrophoropsis aurantiaca TaxID=72124 RepID=A0ACB8A4B1_9AGAM|nr:hypothetical protein BJ138DRAFT_1013523 [Hygrophoropsis aurantiaca]
MHAERFVNLAPLSLLANMLGLWFKDVRTHPPLVLKFPPLDGEAEAVVPLSGLQDGGTRYAAFDSAHSSACSPSWKPSTPNRKTGLNLPNEMLSVDLRSLNLHLQLKVKEILGCSEAMWEWVCQHENPAMTRSEFDDLLVRFELDMREHAGLGSALARRFDWSVLRDGQTQTQTPTREHSASPHPSTRPSRAMRVFVAWKA